MSDESRPRTIRPMELLVVLACIAGAVALFLPAIGTSRRSSGRTECRNNLKQLALALQTYQATYGVLPTGAVHAGTPESPRIGPAWWYGILPYIDQQTLYDKIDHTQSEFFFQPGVEFTYASMPTGGSGRVQTLVRTMIPKYMRCPSSPLPLREQQDGYIAMPSYVAIAGGCDIDPDSSDHQDWPDPSPPQQPYHNRAKGRGPNDAVVTSSGLLPVVQHASLDTCPDGTANTMLVAEQSGFLQPVNPGRADNYHGDPGWNVNTDRNPGGWLTGTDAIRPVPRIDPNESTEPGDWSVAWLFNVTTVRYSPNRKRVIGDSSTPSVAGCVEVMGHNNPLQSPHVGGLQVVLGDGSSQFVGEHIDLVVLLRLAIRDDGQSVELE